jgi:hypothetical protein
MTTLKFKCTLLTDVILNLKSATEGNNQTLDFIPGNCFLGIVAGKLYAQKTSAENLDLFHNATVRFGDAHPVVAGQNIRSLRTPASMYYPKMEKVTDRCFIHHFYEKKEDKENLQLKQCRGGFYAFANNIGIPAVTDKNFAIKSAFDPDKRRSADEKMFGYDSLQKGATFYFSIECDKEGYAEPIKKALVGTQHIGRSRTAQFGLVKIEESDFNEVESKSASDKVTVYADGRLIFLDEYGLPTFQPTEEQLGLPKEAEILWNESQIRTFQYAPYNAKRQTYDTDRCGIEKGSVFVVKVTNANGLTFSSKYIGSYRNEGFGKVIYNPEFLLAQIGTNGLAKYILKENDTKGTENKNGKNSEELQIIGDSNLIKYIRNCQAKKKSERLVYESVNNFSAKYENIFNPNDESFASQWGSIRSLAMTHKSDTLLAAIKDYIGHGVAADKWNRYRRGTDLCDYLEKDCAKLDLREVVINLASEMAKKCKKDSNGK